MNKEELMRMAREAKFEVGGSFIAMDAVGLADFACAILERAAVECEAGVNTDVDWDSRYWDFACKNRASAIRSLKINS